MHLKLISALGLCAFLTACHHDELLKPTPVHRCHQFHTFPGEDDENVGLGFGCAYQNNFALMDAHVRRKNLSPYDGKREAAVLENFRSFKEEKPVVDQKIVEFKSNE